ncbi:hypothetical protein KZ432_10820 [Glaesserella parasuis]|nr:hypothetical protein [Glaesserella parasuis]MCT8841759.1 hypothetical protein [Glaesserella parasuis]
MINNNIDFFKTYSFDICIIGSGIGGGTLAKKLSELGTSFLVIEAGTFHGNSSNVTYENVGRDFGVRTTTTIQVGGTSNLWHGVLAPLDEIDFQQRDWIPYSGWPISLDDLYPYYAEAASLLGVENFSYFTQKNLSNELKQQLENMPFNRNFLKNKLFQQPIVAHNFKNTIKDICSSSDKYHCLFNTTALELVRNGEYVEKVIVGLANGEKSEIKAKQFIIASGALETPRLLLNSKFTNPNIGRFLMDHPMGNLCQLEFRKRKKCPIYSDTKYSHKMKIKTGLEMKNELQEKFQLPNNNFYMRPSFIKGIDDKSEKIKLSLLAFKDGKISIKDFLNVFMHPNVIRQILAYKLSLNVTYKYSDLFFITEQIPNPESNVTLSNLKDKWGYPISRVNWQVSQQDIDAMEMWFKLVLTEFFSEEDYIFTHALDDFNWKEIFTSAIHHVGTARMGNNEDEAVVNKDLKVFGINNLYICDGSIFTTAGNVNNGLSISAFACRLVKHLGEKE